MKNEQENTITTGNIWKQLLLFFFPILIGNVFQLLYNTSDAVIVGRYLGDDALAGVGGSASIIFTLFINFFTGLSTGVTVAIAQYYGAGEQGTAEEALHTAYVFALLFGVFTGCAGILTAPVFLRILRTPQALLSMSAVYLRMLFAGILFTLIYNMGSAILRAIGDSKRPLFILMCCCAANIVLDLAFVGVLRLGVFGVGLATALCQGGAAAAVTYLLARRTPKLTLSVRKLHLSGFMLSKILKVGLPIALSGCLYTFTNMFVQSAVNSMGVNTVAAWTAYSKLDSFWWMIDQAFTISITTFVGQNYGAEKPKRIHRAVREVYFIETFFALAIGGMIAAFSAELIGLFSSSAEVVRLGSVMARGIAPFFWIYVFYNVFASTLRAENHVMFVTVMNFLCICVFRFLYVGIVSANRDIAQLVACYPVSWFMTSVIIGIFYFITQPKIDRKLIQ